jgi:outer membrane protein OmpA-like peptidoglycan-associated protein
MRTVSVFLLAFALSGCASFGAPPTAPPLVRPACVSGVERIYFNLDSEALPPNSRAVFTQLAGYLNGCAAQGGELVAFTVIAFPDRNETGEAADALADARAVEVRDALVAAGAPAAQIIDQRPRREDPDRIMRRHATIRYEQR